ncbi:hypothetical protein KSS87_011603 [Heliosperma pusillum]|nr:hypothetical protein KSS87_011603 [Heliosperma pusillum]
MTTPTSIVNTSNPSHPLVLINLSMVEKLTPLTFLPWKTQIESILFGYDLVKYLDGSHPLPPPTITTTPAATSTDPTPESKTIPNPAHQSWLRLDRLLYGALLGTIPPTVSPLVIRSTTAKEAWDILSATYANPSRGHILQIKERLNSLTKNTQPISDYMQAIKACTDQLAIMGKPMDQEDIISKTLKGLDYDTFKPIIDAIMARDEPITFEALHEKLINFELTHTQTTQPAPFPASANPAWRLWNEEQVMELVDETVEKNVSWEEAMKCIHIALLCIQEDAAKRPRITSVVSALNGDAIDLPSPSAPHFFMPGPFGVDESNTEGSGTTFTGSKNITVMDAR